MRKKMSQLERMERVHAAQLLNIRYEQAQAQAAYNKALKGK